MRLIAALLASLAAVAPLGAAAQTLDIYFIDTEGGQATLYVSPEGETLLVDTGNPGERDHSRLMEVLRTAGVQRIDHLVLTHYHGDHYGGIEALAEVMPIGHFYDHGETIEDRASALEFQQRYAALAGRIGRTIVQPGDRIPFAGVDVIVVASHGRLLDTPLAGAPGVGDPNPACASFQEMDLSQVTDPDNESSVGMVFSYGRFRTINLGDLTWNHEFPLMCPNKVGTVDLYLTSHHGLDRSGSEVLVHGLRPRVAVMNNGTRKGGSAKALQILHTSPGLEDLWQLHWSYHGTVEQNTPGMFIANIDAPDVLAGVINPPAGEGAGGPGAGGPGGGAAARNAGAHTPAYWIHVSARQDGSFTVTNTRTGFSKTYAAADRN